MAIEKNRVKRIWDQKGSLADHKLLKSYFESTLHNSELKEELNRQWDAEQNWDQYPTPDLHQNFNRLLNDIKQKKQNSRLRLSSWISSVAALFFIALFISTLLYYKHQDQLADPVSAIEIQSYNGFRSQFSLPDGTTGWLGYQSKLNYWVDQAGVRRVQLDGLAYFDVAHLSSDSPFVVTSPSSLEIQVLGTRFNINAYSGEPGSEVILEEGSVLLSRNNEKLVRMKPNERVYYNRATNQCSRSTVDIRDYMAWKDGRLVLNGTSLSESCIRLSRFYNVNIELAAPELKDQKVRLILEDEKLEEALSLLCMLLPVTYEIIEPAPTGPTKISKRKIILKAK